METLVLLLEKDTEASVFVVRELVFLDADNASDFCELGFVSVQGRSVDGRDLDSEVFVGSLGLGFLVLWWRRTIQVICFPVRVGVCFFAEERSLRVRGRPRVVCDDIW